MAAFWKWKSCGSIANFSRLQLLWRGNEFQALCNKYSSALSILSTHHNLHRGCKLSDNFSHDIMGPCVDEVQEISVCRHIGDSEPQVSWWSWWWTHDDVIFEHVVSTFGSFLHFPRFHQMDGFSVSDTWAVWAASFVD